MEFSQQTAEFIRSFGISESALFSFAKIFPFLIIIVAVISFYCSNMLRMKQESREKIAAKLKVAATNSSRGLTAAEIAKRIAPQADDEGGRKFLVSVAESLLKIAKFDRKATEVKLRQSGDRDPRAISRYILQRGAGMAIAPFFGWLMFSSLGFSSSMQVVGSLVCVLAGGIIVDIRLDKALKERRERMATEFPVFLDLLTIYIGSGQAFDTALAKASSALGVSFPTASEEVMFLRQDLDLSVDRKKTLREFAERINSEIAKTFVSIVIQAERRGNETTPAIRVLAKDARQGVILDIERKAQKLPTLMQLPMFLFILPAIFMSVIGPAAIEIADKLKDF